ncbi:hypothetical protein [Thalassovita sp.]|uniref:hypothetical protein n=1 Tax=Thalassovita sp. TaxID=1979401 RepID=UPI0029DE7F26|nr:hypothetical protein [Thalassovita sp.]
MRKPRPPIFLERTSYRQRRIRDGARLMPFIGAVLWGIPILWAPPGEHGISTSRAMLYIFGVWFLLVLASFALSRWLQPDVDADPSDRP